MYGPEVAINGIDKEKIAKAFSLFI